MPLDLPPQPIPLCVALLAIVAASTDLCARRIPNRLIVVGLAGALLAQGLTRGPLDGTLTWLAGAATGLAVLLPFYLLRGMAAGDVKLMLAIGAWVGPPLTLRIALATAVIGGAWALVTVLRAGRSRAERPRPRSTTLSEPHHGATMKPESAIASPPATPATPRASDAAATGRARLASGVPSAPHSLAETGLSEPFVATLLLKSMLLHGRSTLSELIARHRLPAAVLDEVLSFVVRERLVEVAQRGSTDIDLSLRLTDAGRALARDETTRGTYCGPAPVPYDTYLASVAAHSVRRVAITRADAHASFEDFVIDTALLDAAAASMNAGRPLLLHGPAGSGKTCLAERLGGLLVGNVPIPHAVLVAGEVIQIHDPLIHRDAPQPIGIAAGDRRWRLCRRPVVLSGGELTLNELDLRRDAVTGVYQAPPHLKANMGLYIVDDLGRQRTSPRDLLNRWLLPLDRDIDLLTLSSGARIEMPFDVWPVFSTNLAPDQLGDDAFLRRLGSKLEIGPLSSDAYARIFEASRAALGLVAPPEALAHLLEGLHRRTAKPLLACYPHDLLRLVAAAVRYRDEPNVVTPATLDDAWLRYFGSLSAPDGATLL